jgi:predicted HicB family RNase H-like nuclease
MANRPTKMGRPSTGKITVQLRMAASTRTRLEKAATKQHVSLSDYAEEAILTKLKKDKVE